MAQARREMTLFNEGGVIVSSSRFVVSGQTYAMSGVTSVRAIKHSPSRKGPIILIAIGAIALSGGSQTLPGALLFIAAGILWWYLHRPKYSVVLCSSSGEAPALVSKDEHLISRVLDALNEAIVARG